MAAGPTEGTRGARLPPSRSRRAGFVDTDMLLRAVDGDAGPQGRAVRERIRAARETGETLTVMAPTVLEVGYVLESARAGYGWGRESVCRALDAILDEPAFATEHQAALWTAVATYEARSIDLHDCFLSAIADERGTRVLSFDADLRRLGSGERP